MVTSEFSSPFLINVSVAYMSHLPNALKIFKCDTDHIFSTTYHQSLKPQQVFGKCIIKRMAKVMVTTGTLNWYLNASWPCFRICHRHIFKAIPKKKSVIYRQLSLVYLIKFVESLDTMFRLQDIKV